MDMGREKADSDNDTQKMTKFKLQIQDVPARRSQGLDQLRASLMKNSRWYGVLWII